MFDLPGRFIECSMYAVVLRPRTWSLLWSLDVTLRGRSLLGSWCSCCFVPHLGWCVHWLRWCGVMLSCFVLHMFVLRCTLWNRFRIGTNGVSYEVFWYFHFVYMQLAKLSFNHSHGRTHSWRFSTFYKIYVYAYPLCVTICCWSQAVTLFIAVLLSLSVIVITLVY